MDKLQEEFTTYQLLQKSQIPDAVWKDAKISEESTEEGQKVYYRMDMVWGYLSGAKEYDGSLKFPYLSQVGRLVMVIPHSNAGEERVFNLIRQNKTQFRPSLNNDGTLSSLIQVKLANHDSCVTWDPPKSLLKTAKGATKRYNDMHRN